MNHDSHRDRIWIGEEQWIEFIDLAGRQESAIEIDPIIGILEPLWGALESICAVECCGIDAFDFSPAAIAKVEELRSSTDFGARIRMVKAQLLMIESDAFVSKRMNNYFDKKVFLALMDHLESQFLSIANGTP